MEEKVLEDFSEEQVPQSSYLIQPIKFSSSYLVADLRTRETTRFEATMRWPKFFACAMRGEHAFVTGGLIDDEKSGKAWRLSHDGSVMEIKSHLIGRAEHALAALQSRPMILASGGILENAQEVSSDCEMLMVEENRWKKVESMRVARRWHASTSLRDQNIYVFCGDHQQALLSSVECFEVSSGHWQMVHIRDSNPTHRWKRRALLATVQVSKLEILVFGQKDANPEALLLSEEGNALVITDSFKSKVSPYAEGFQDPAARFGNELFTMTWVEGVRSLLRLDLQHRPYQWTLEM